jgi:hypothetical protein
MSGDCNSAHCPIRTSQIVSPLVVRKKLQAFMSTSPNQDSWMRSPLPKLCGALDGAAEASVDAPLGRWETIIANTRVFPPVCAPYRPTGTEAFLVLDTRGDDVGIQKLFRLAAQPHELFLCCSFRVDTAARVCLPAWIRCALRDNGAHAVHQVREAHWNASPYPPNWVSRRRTPQALDSRSTRILRYQSLRCACVRRKRPGLPEQPPALIRERG